jgi:hypothetical protein
LVLPGPIPPNDFKPLAPNLQHLTIRTERYVSRKNLSWLPSAAEIIKLFISSLQHLVIELTKLDCSPLAILADVSLSILRIDPYVHNRGISASVTYSQLMCLLDDYEGVVRLIKDGVLVIHSEKTAPDA